jgi:hypothetical protein
MGAERRGDGAKEVPAAGAAAVWISQIGAQPASAGFALWIDALHREARQVLHLFSYRRPLACVSRGRREWLPTLDLRTGCWRGLWRDSPVVSREKTTRYGGGCAKDEEKQTEPSEAGVPRWHFRRLADRKKKSLPA